VFGAWKRAPGVRGKGRPNRHPVRREGERAHAEDTVADLTRPVQANRQKYD
jgi:hypothetical protein